MSALTDKLLEGISDNLDAAQADLVAAELAHVEAAAERQTAEEAVSRLKAAVAALQGKAVTQPDSSTADAAAPSGELPKKQVESPTKQVANKPAKKAAKNTENNPLGHLKCSGCGEVGSMQESYVQSPGGANVRTLICANCSNQTF